MIVTFKLPKQRLTVDIRWLPHLDIHIKGDGNQIAAVILVVGHLFDPVVVRHLNDPNHETLHYVIHHDIAVHTARAYTFGFTNL